MRDQLITPPPSESAKTAESDTEASSQSVNKQHTQPHDKLSDKTLIDWLVLFNVPSTARSFRDSTPIYCPLQRTINKPFRPGIEPQTVAWQSITLPLR